MSGIHRMKNKNRNDRRAGEKPRPGRKTRLRNLLCALLAAALALTVVLTGVLERPSNAVADALYQSARPLDGKVFVIGIDAKSLEELGPFNTWDRSYIARAIEILNADPENRPAAIGIDVIMASTTQPEADAAMVEAAARYGNVVTAAAVNYDSTLVLGEDGSFYMDQFHISSVDMPFAALAEVSTPAHVNAMFDTDGIVRHGLLEETLPDGSTLPAFHYALYRLYAEENGLDPQRKPPVNGQSFWYIPFSGAPGAYDNGYSFSDLLNGDVPADRFGGKVVFIGPYAAGMMDYITTSIDHSRLMYGVEYQANAVSALIRGDFVREASLLPQYILLFLAVAGSVLLYYRRKVWQCTLAWALTSGGWVGICLLAHHWGLLLNVLWIPGWVSITYVGSVAVNYTLAAAERRRVTNTFKRYVAPQVVNEILKGGAEALELGGKLCDIAVLFVDIRGFTTMSEVLQPTEVVDILNHYLSLTADCVLRNGGTLDKFVGDCTMAIFNAPLPQEDYIYHAARTAMDMVEGSREMSQKLMEEFGRTVAFGVGIHCGSAVVGNIGAEIRMDYTAIGDTVNTAARLEANAPGGSIYISRAVADALGERAKTTSLGDTIRLKGKAAGFEILTLDELL